MNISERKQALREELAIIEKCEAIMEDQKAADYMRSLLQIAPAQQLPLIVEQPVIAHNGHYRQPRVLKNVGARRQVLINLLTGPTTREDLAAAMKWEFRLVNQTLDSMLRAKLVGVEGNRLYLTGEGKAHAVWFQTHPGTKVHSKK